MQKLCIRWKPCFSYSNRISGWTKIVNIYVLRSNPEMSNDKAFVSSFHWRAKYLCQYNLTAVNLTKTQVLFGVGLARPWLCTVGPILQVTGQST